MNTDIGFTCLSLLHPDLLPLPEPPKKCNNSFLFDSAFDLKESIMVKSPMPNIKRNSHSNLSNYISSPETDDNIDLGINLSSNNLSDYLFNIKYDIGNGNMDYITETRTREMCENAWKAISLTDNWYFVSEPIESFSSSQDKRIDIISEKMKELGYRGHSGASFGLTMRNMQYLVKNGEEKFKEIFIKKPISKEIPIGTTGSFGRMVFSYCGGF